MADAIRGGCAIVTKVARRDHQQLLDRHQAGINALEHGVLRRLAHGAQTLAELSQLMAVTPSTLVYTIDGLARKGLVIRRTDKTDRRREPLALTTNGQHVLAGIPNMDTDSAITHALRCMSQRDRTALLKLMSIFIAGFPAAKNWGAEVASLARYQTVRKRPKTVHQPKAPVRFQPKHRART